MENRADIAIIGGGIVGLAHAYMALRKGYKVVLFERDLQATGASIRNFGLLWPIGQEPGVGLEYALRSRQHWTEVSEQAGFWYRANGSMHVVYHDDELDVLHEFMALYRDRGFQCSLLTPDQVIQKSPVIRREGLKGGLWSDTEGTVYSREAIRKIPEWLAEKFGLITRFGHTVKEIAMPTVRTAQETWTADKVFVCGGADFESLYPEVFGGLPITKCKLQMMKAVPERPVTIGPSLCAGLTLRHYAAFTKCPSLQKVDERYDQQSLRFKSHGIHVLLAQNQYGELIIGDSHHYGRSVEPFDSEEVNNIILDYLNSFVDIGPMSITERWHGVYAKHPGKIHYIAEPEKDVTIVTGLSGAGMTLSFGLAEEIISKL
jgi:FAD dependent oxidoreductase TIGR03364